MELEWGEWGKEDFKRRDQTLTLSARVFIPGDPDQNRPATDTPGGGLTIEIDLAAPPKGSGT